jgi:integrase
MIVKLKYLSRERSGLFLYFRQIPADLRHHYEGRILRRQSLQTHDPGIAAKEALRLAKLDDQIWEALRSGTNDVETARATVTETNYTLLLRRILAKAKQPRLSDALAQYLRKHQGRDVSFVQNANRAFATVKNILGDPELKDIKRANARRVLDSMLSKGLKTASVKRYLNTISAIFSAGILELELDLKNPFSALTIPNYLEDTKDIPSFSDAELRQIATAGLAQKIEPGLIASMQVETGCRVREIALLRTGDVCLDAPIPYIKLVEHKEHGRSLKTGKDAERALPLVGVSLEAARIAAEHGTDGGWLFPKIGKGNPASTVNRWLIRTIGGEAGRSHSFRHAMETRLVLAKVDQRLVDAIIGHKPQAKMGSVYFSGYGLSDLAEALGRIALPFPGRDVPA